MRAIITFVLALAVGIVLASCVTINGASSHSIRARGTDHQTVAHVENSALAVESRNGSVTITADPSIEQVQVDAKITCVGETEDEADQRLAATKIEIIRAADQTLSVKPAFPDKPRGGDGVSFEIRIPGADGVTIASSNGKVFVAGHDGRLTGLLDVRTSNGGVEVVKHAGKANIVTSNGSIRVNDLDGSLVADTSNGAIQAVDIGGSIKADTSNGAVTISLRDDQPGPVAADTSNGGVTITVGPSFAGEVVLDTSNGRIKVEDDAGTVRSKEINKSEGRLVIGEGGSRSVIDTSNGSIVFKVVKSASAEKPAAN